MGWTSTGDPYANVGEAGLTFDSADSAKAFAEKHGWDYVVSSYYLSIHSWYLTSGLKNKAILISEILGYIGAGFNCIFSLECIGSFDS